MELSQYERAYRLEDWHWWFVSRQQLAAELLERWAGSTAQRCILDVGCGSGGNLGFLSQWGRVIGVDLKALPLNFARRRPSARLVQASGLRLPYPSHTFDLVTAFDVLYHRWISDDDRAIGEFYRVLRPGGWLLVTDSALPLLWSPHDKIYYTRQRYTLPNLRQKLSQAGFKAGVCSYANTLLLPIMAIMRLMMAALPCIDDLTLYPPPKWLNRWLIEIRNLELMWLRRGGTLPLGSSVICLSQKPVGAAETWTVPSRPLFNFAAEPLSRINKQPENVANSQP